MEEKELDEFLYNFYKLKKASKDKRYGFNDNFDLFIKMILFLSPRSYGTKIENRFIEKNNFKKVSSNEKRGDFLYEDNYYEVKSSILTVTNKIANITNIRTYQDIEGYYILIIDARNIKCIKKYLYYLDKNDMGKELECLNACPTSGTKDVNISNKNIPLSIKLDVNNKNNHFIRWEKKYNQLEKYIL